MKIGASVVWVSQQVARNATDPRKTPLGQIAAERIALVNVSHNRPNASLSFSIIISHLIIQFQVLCRTVTV